MKKIIKNDALIARLLTFKPVAVLANGSSFARDLLNADGDTIAVICWDNNQDLVWSMIEANNK